MSVGVREHLWTAFASAAASALIQRYGSPVNPDEDFGHTGNVAVISGLYADKLVEQFEVRFAKQKRSTNLLKGEER